MSRSYGSAVSSTVMLLIVDAEISTGDVCIILMGGRGLESRSHNIRHCSGINHCIFNCKHFFSARDLFNYHQIRDFAAGTAFAFSEKCTVIGH